MSFKYQEDMNTLSNFKCPPDNYKQLDVDAYRWVFDDIKDSKNFTPRYYIKPKKENDPKPTEQEKCDEMALSMFISEDSAKKRFNFFFKIFKKRAYKIFGTKIAHKKLNINDGVNEEPNNIGHFNHHPYSHVDYETQFKIVGNIS